MDINEAYKILEVPDSATLAEIKSAYAHMVMVWHPDRLRHTNNNKLLERAESKMQQINEAFQFVQQNYGSPAVNPPPFRENIPASGPGPENISSEHLPSENGAEPLIKYPRLLFAVGMATALSVYLCYRRGIQVFDFPPAITVFIAILTVLVYYKCIVFAIELAQRVWNIARKIFG